MSDSRRLLISTGEPSGDAHAARVVTAFRRRRPEIEIDAVGGEALEAAGARLRANIDDLSVIGFAEALQKLPAHWRLLRALAGDLRANRYRAVMLVDYPGFHLRLAEAAKRAGVPVLYYIAPQFWAWGERRVTRFARAVDRVAVILPFEEDFFRARGVEASYVGHPLVDREPPPGSGEARRRLGLAPEDCVLGLFPGSRRQEVARHWPVFRDAALRVLARRNDVTVVVGAAPRAAYPDPGPIRIVAQDPLAVFAAATAAIAKSGTTTLEAALGDTPMVIAYRTHLVTYLIARRILNVRWVGLVNLVGEREIAPELLQRDATPVRLADAVLELLDPGSGAAKRQREGLAEVRRRLGGPGAAERVAGMLEALVCRP